MKYTKEEFDVLLKKQATQNALYKEASNEQIKKWMGGVSEHNMVDRISSVVDANGAVVDFYTLPGGECCPDFSCCTGEIWPLEKRLDFDKAIQEGDQKTRQRMLSDSLRGFVVASLPNATVQ